MPVVLSSRLSSRSQIRPQAGVAVPRRGSGPWPEDRHQLDPCRWPEQQVPALLHDGRGGRQAGRQHRRSVDLRGGQALGCRPDEAHLGARRHADSALWALRPRSRHPSQPGSRSGWLAACLRPHLGGARAAGPSSRLGSHRLAAVGPAVRASQGPARHQPEAPAGVQDQAGDGRRTAAACPVLAPASGQATVGGGRRGLRQGPVPQASDVARDDGCQSAATRTRPCGRCQGPGCPGGAGGPESTGRAASSWSSGLGSVAGGRRAFSSCTASRRRSGTRRSRRRGGRPADDPGGAGRRAEWMGRLLLHRRVGERGRDPLDGRRPVLAGPRSATARRSSEPASSRCGMCGQTSVHSTFASGRSR